jgi:DHA1 family inner membrane transport protein
MSSCYYVMGLDEQEKNSAASLLSKSAVAMLMITAIPLLTEQYGWRAMYVCLAALVIPCLILARHFPNEYLQGFRQDAQTTAESGERGIWILLATALSGISILMLWPYMDSLGADVGVPQGSINLALSLAAGSGFVSSALAMWAGRRITIPGVLLICMIVNLVGVLVTLLGSSTAFIAGVLMYYFTLPIYLSAQFGVAMRTAVSKRFGVTYSIVLHAATLGPALGGFIAHSLGFPALRVAYILVMATAFCIVWMENLRLRRAQLAQDCSGPATEHA